MTTNSLRNIRILLCLFFCFRMTPFIYAGEFLFTTINASQGLSDNQIRYILQLPDGRMVFTTSGNVNLYDGVHFSYLHRTTEYVYPLNQYIQLNITNITGITAFTRVGILCYGLKILTN